MKLSILILTIQARNKKLKRLEDILRPQLTEEVELIIKENLAHADGGPIIGANRNEALSDAIGDYVCFVDDDDIVPDYYVEEILKAIESYHSSLVIFHPVTALRNEILTSKGISNVLNQQ